MEDNIIKEQEPLPTEEAKTVKEEKIESEEIAESEKKPRTTRKKATKPQTDESSPLPTEKKPRTRRASSESVTKRSPRSAENESMPVESSVEVENTEKADEAVDIAPPPPIEETEAPFPEIVITVPEVIESPKVDDESPTEVLVDSAKNPIETEDITEENPTAPESESSIDESELIAETEKNFDESESEDAIIPPDELFAYRAKPVVEPAEIEQEVTEEIQEASLEPEDHISEKKSVDEDGQYQFTDLEPLPSQTEEKLEPKLDKYDPKKPRSIDKRFDLVELFVFTLLAVMIITTFFFRHSIVDGDSMIDTLHNGEHLIISDFFYTPKRGDIIVCEDYSTSLKKPIVKRVIAIEGDTIEIKSGQVRVNGKLLDESDYLYIDGIDVTKPVSLTVPENEIFVMGDHRNDSEDSRSIGTISEDAVLGKVILRFYPFDKFGPVN